jgi:hypothetical protein
MDEDSARSLDDVLADLNRTTERLRSATDLGERANLRDHLNVLRREAADARGAVLTNLSDEQLDRQIRSVQRALDNVGTQRFDPSMVAGASGYGGGLDPILTARHNQRVDEAGGREDLELQLRRCLEEASRRRSQQE